jgi:hypothetical protein
MNTDTTAMPLEITAVHTYQTIGHHIPKDHTIHIRDYENLMSHVRMFLYVDRHGI